MQNNDEDLDQEGDRDDTYYLKTPSNTFDPVAKTYSSKLILKHFNIYIFHNFIHQ